MWDSHPTCSRCRDRNCTANMTCDICKDWSVAQWEAFLKKHSYSGCRKPRPSGSDLPAAPPTLPPSALASSEAGCPAPLPHPPPPFRQRGMPVQERRRVPLVFSLVGSSLPPSAVRWERRGGGGCRRGCGF